MVVGAGSLKYIDRPGHRDIIFIQKDSVIGFI